MHQLERERQDREAQDRRLKQKELLEERDRILEEHVRVLEVQIRLLLEGKRDLKRDLIARREMQK